MPRDHGVVRPGFWTGQTGKELRKHPNAQRVAFYLMTCPHVEMVGIYNLPILYVWNEVGLTEAEAVQAFEILDELGFAYRDRSADLVWVPNLAREQVGQTCSVKDNKQKAIAKQLRSHRGHPFVGAFLDYYAAPYHLDRADFESPSKAPADPLERGSSKGSNSPYALVPVPGLAPDPPSGLADRVAAAYAAVSGSDEMRGDGCRTPKQDQAILRMMSWSERDLSTLVTELKLLSSDAFLGTQPIHVWAERLGTGKAGPAKKPGPHVASAHTDYETGGEFLP